MSIESLVIQLGINLTSSFIYERVKDYFKKTDTPTIKGLKSALASSLNIDNAELNAEKIVNFLAQNGDITISGTQIYVSDSIAMASSKGTKFDFGNNSSSTTYKSSIKAGLGARIVGQGGARIVQDNDGSIKFYA